MVYESDFYTTRRPYRPSYSATMKQEFFPWEKVPYVPRPSQIPDPFTVWGQKKNHTPKSEQSASVEKGKISTYTHHSSSSHHEKICSTEKIPHKHGMQVTPQLSAQKLNSRERRNIGTLIPTITPMSNRINIILNLQKPSWYKF